MVSRQRAWADTAVNVSIASAAAGAVTDLRGSLDVPENMTLVRLILDLDLLIDPEIETNGEQVLHLGVGVTSVEAFTAGAVPLPSITTQYPPRGWLYVASKSVYQTVHASGQIWRKDQRFRLDLRGARKVDRGVLYMITENDTQGGGALAVILRGRVRALFLL